MSAGVLGPLLPPVIRSSFVADLTEIDGEIGGLRRNGEETLLVAQELDAAARAGVERAVIPEKSDRIQPASLPQSIALFQVEAIAADRVKTLEELNREYAEKVLEHVEQNRAKAAALLGISRTSLWRILKKEGEASA